MIKEWPPEKENQNTPAENVDFENKIDGALSEFEKRDSEAVASIHEKFGNKPTSFFNDNNFKEIENISAGKRLKMLAIVGSYLTVTPGDVKKYFDYFPNDLSVVESLYIERNGMPTTTFEHMLFGLTASLIYKELSSHDYRIESYKETESRRELAPKFLLDIYKEGGWENSFGEFGEAADGLSKVVGEAAEMAVTGEYIINPEKIFTPEYNELSADKKSLFLERALALMQHHLIFEETFNSLFTRERIMEDRERYKNVEFGLVQHNPAHSILFRTYQPLPVFEFSREYFVQDMNSSAMIGGYVEEYPYHRIILALLDEMKKIESPEKDLTSTVVDFWNKNRNPIFGRSVAEVLSRQNPRIASELILEQIREEDGDKEALTSVLYRLELGRIGISEEGVEYLGKLYDLGQLNNPDFFVNRLTAEGDVGVFDENKELINYFNLGDISGKEEEVKPAILDITADLLFRFKDQMSEEDLEKAHGYLKEIKKNYHEFYLTEFYEKTGVRFNNLSFEEQGWFMVFVRSGSEDEKERAYEFVRKHGESGLKIFLALQFDEDLGETILEIGERADDLVTERIFSRIENITSMASGISEYVQENFGTEAGVDTSEDLRQNLLSEIPDFLKRLSKVLSEEGYEENKDKILEELDDIRTETTLFLTTFQALKRDGVSMDVEDIKAVDFALNSPEGLSPDEISEMREIYSKNYEHNPELQEVLLEKFDEIFSGENEGVFYTLKYKGDIKAFMRFTQITQGEDNEDTVHWSALNVEPDFQHASLGGTFIDKGIEIEAAKHEDIRGESAAFGRPTMIYIEKGFVADKFFTFGGNPSVSIHLNHPEYASKNLSKEEIVEIAHKGEGAEFEVISTSSLEDVPMEKLNDGKVLTRYFKSGEKYYAIFEDSKDGS